MITTPINQHIEDQMSFPSQLCPVPYAQMAVPQQGLSLRNSQCPGESKRKRQRKKRGENGSQGLKKRKLTAEQVSFLEVNFGNEHKLESERKDRLASELGLDPRQVAVWFQNRRARWKNQKLEEEYSNLKKLHETEVLDKRRLESEVLQIKEQLAQAEKEIQRLSEKLDGVSSNSPNSTLTVDNIDSQILGGFGAEGYDDVFYMPYTGYMNGIDQWFTLCM